ncbi:MAG: pyridoxamine 5'-phosphate oxidase family protein [Anaerolineales bacterium]|nr:pyridoxamine 5'-phosphate oxidase family protein [Anaerolineales bacterium]MCS7248986.1 pyridoxamine 5'-phosphate oxidase family protein [Anaerolineales bacterium]MDW8162799.1 pyridoxamine 5'-phosphate oxidase family protein [Anaerolineales bacterium]MDW8448309.1 pyridoxamine 5'-phosphate oxidase family protein [Anaerolineales bacterium]
MDSVMREEIRVLLGLSTMTLATCGASGEPHAAPVYFVADEATLELYFFSEASSQHSLDLCTNPSAAVAIYPEVWEWQAIRGLQMRGRVNIVSPGEEWQRAWQAYQRKFPFVRHLEAVVARARLYRFQPTWLRWIDNRYGLGHKQEWNLP